MSYSLAPPCSQASMCLEDFFSQQVERHNKPEVEVSSSKELLLNPIVVSRNDKERVLIEPSINAIRVSIAIKQGDDSQVPPTLAHNYRVTGAQHLVDYLMFIAWRADSVAPQIKSE